MYYIELLNSGDSKAPDLVTKSLNWRSYSC